MRRLPRPRSSALVALNRFGQKVSTLAVFDLYHPQVRVDPNGSFYVGIVILFGLTGHGRDPDCASVALNRFTQQSNASVTQMTQSDQQGPCSGVALAFDHGKATAQFGTADQGCHPNVGGKIQETTFANLVSVLPR
jgi:hypothetical protein